MSCRGKYGVLTNGHRVLSQTLTLHLINVVIRVPQHFRVRPSRAFPSKHPPTQWRLSACRFSAYRPPGGAEQFPDTTS